MPVIQEIANDKLEHVRRNLLVPSFLVLFWSVWKINGFSVNYDVWTQVWESAGWKSCPAVRKSGRLWVPTSRCGTSPPACSWTRSPPPWTGSVSCAGKGIKSVICSVINIHPFPYSRGGWGSWPQQNDRTQNLAALPLHDPGSVIKSPRTPTRWAEAPRPASLTVPPTQACFFILFRN